MGRGKAGHCLMKIAIKDRDVLKAIALSRGYFSIEEWVDCEEKPACCGYVPGMSKYYGKGLYTAPGYSKGDGLFFIDEFGYYVREDMCIIVKE